MSEIFYQKRGRRFRPAAVERAVDGLPNGCYLVEAGLPHGVRLYRLPPDEAGLLLDTPAAVEAMVSAMVKASALRLEQPPRTAEQQAAWEDFCRVMGEAGPALTPAQALDVVRAVLDRPLGAGP